MIIGIFGAPGAGKSSLNTYFLKTTYETEGSALLTMSRDSISAVNESRNNKLKLPQRVPLYSDFKVRFKVAYETWYEPYYINGFYFGIENDRLATQYVVPYAHIHLSEAQRYFDSRKSKSFPAFVSRAFEMHRHYGLEIYMDVQRITLIDLNIRQIIGKFIEVLRVEHKQTSFGKIESSTWFCREFDSWLQVEEYLESGKQNYVETTYHYDGDIFECFDSHAYFSEFLPPDDKNFTYLRHLDGERLCDVPDQYRKFYEWAEPEEYRTEKKPLEKENDRKNRRS